MKPRGISPKRLAQVRQWLAEYDALLAEPHEQWDKDKQDGVATDLAHAVPDLLAHIEFLQQRIDYLTSDADIPF